MIARNKMKNLKVDDQVVVGSSIISSDGTLTGNPIQDYVEYTATATNTHNTGFIGLNHASTAIEIDIPAPGSAGKMLIIKDTSASGTASHVCTAVGGTFDGTNNTATFDAPGELLILYSVSATDWTVVLNSGSVGLSSV